MCSPIDSVNNFNKLLLELTCFTQATYPKEVGPEGLEEPAVVYVALGGFIVFVFDVRCLEVSPHVHKTIHKYIQSLRQHLTFLISLQFHGRDNSP